MMIMHEWRAWQRAANLSERTVRERALTVEALCRDAGVPPSDIQPGHVVAFLSRRNLSPTTRATYHASLRVFFAWMVARGHRPDDPTADTPRPKRPAGIPRPVQSEQLGAILVACSRSRTRAMVLLAALAGLRVHEVAKIQGEDLDLAAGTLTVTGKGGKTAFIPLHPILATMAAEEWPRRGYWFTSYRDRSKPITSRAVGKAISAAMDRAGVAGTAHQLRHWYGTELLEAGASLRTVQELMRHESVATTQIYTKVTSARRREAIGRLVLPEAA